MPPLRILLAEDEGVVARLISRVLRGDGETVDHVTSCREAIERLRSQDYDLVMLDMNLKDGDAFTVVDELEARPGGGPPVILMTGMRFEEGDPRPGRVDAVLPKPFDVARLEQAVDAFRREA